MLRQAVRWWAHGGTKRATALVREKRTFADLKERERDVPQLSLEDSEPLDSVGAYAAFQLVTEGRCQGT
jgi:hypothetical protein